MKRLLLIFLLVYPSGAMAGWIEYSIRANGDVFFYDDARVQKTGHEISVWNRVRYKTTLMGAASQQSLLRIHCTEFSETTLQSTFYSDKNWTTPAMAPNMKEKPKKAISKDSATAQLANILCKK